MPREPKAYLHDMRQAAALIAGFTDGLDFDAYAADAMVRAAVERQFEIIGEALGQLAKRAGRRTRGGRRRSSDGGTRALLRMKFAMVAAKRSRRESLMIRPLSSNAVCA